MDNNLLKSYIVKFGETQADLASAMGISLSRLNAKINGTGGAEFSQSEISFLANRYRLTETEIMSVFFNHKVS